MMPQTREDPARRRRAAVRTAAGLGLVAVAIYLLFFLVMGAR